MGELKLTFKVSDLLNIIKENREKHNQISTEARSNYKIELEKELTEKLELLKKGHKVNPHCSQTPPKDNLDSYDIVLGMLEHTTDQTIELDQRQFGQYVQDNWHWTEAFLAGTSSYSTLARREYASKFSQD